MVRSKFPRDIALNHTFSACNRTDYPGGYSLEYYHNMAAWLLEALEKAAREKVGSVDDIVDIFGKIAEREILKQRAEYFPDTGPRFHLESLLMNGCPQKACDAENNGSVVLSKCHYFSELATVTDSFSAIREAVFELKLLTLEELNDCVKNDFDGKEELAVFLRHRCPKYGNSDDRADRFAKRISEMVFSSLDKANKLSGADTANYGGFYSLFKHHGKKWTEHATPDGRRAFEPLSENQSPVYGADKNGITSLINSVTAAGLDKSAIGGLNITLAQKPSAETLEGLLDVYFAHGGVHAGVTVVNRLTLEDAMEHPERYPTLYVRVTGYSELFTSLFPHMQREIINRTQY